MHELSIVEALLEQVRQEARAYPALHVHAIRLRIGALRQVVPETLKFCFTAAVQETELAGCTLELEPLPAMARCRKCNRTFPVDDNWFQCPECGESGSELLTGNELELTSLDLK